MKACSAPIPRPFSDILRESPFEPTKHAPLHNLRARFEQLEQENEEAMNAAELGEIAHRPLLHQELSLAEEAIFSAGSVLRSYLELLTPFVTSDPVGMNTPADAAMTVLDHMHPHVLSKWSQLDFATRHAWVELMLTVKEAAYDVQQFLEDLAQGRFENPPSSD